MLSSAPQYVVRELRRAGGLKTTLKGAEGAEEEQRLRQRRADAIIALKPPPHMSPSPPRPDGAGALPC